MRLDQDLRTLSERMRDAASVGAPYVLVLGAASAHEAGVPTLDELGSRAGLHLEPTNRSLIDRLLYDLPVPAPYQDIANLSREGYLSPVVTTAYDTLIERALTDAGLRAPSHFSVVELGVDDESASPDSSLGASLQVIHVFDAHGAPVAPATLARAVRRHEGAALNVVVVGFQFESPAILEWLKAAPHGHLHWVSAEPRPDAHGQLGWRGEWAETTGESGEPAEFFGRLSLLLLGLRSSVADATDESGELDSAYLQNRLETAKVAKYAVGRSRMSAFDPGAMSQLSYQQRQIDELEIKLAAASSQALLTRMRHYRQWLEQRVDDPSVPVDEATVEFFDTNLRVLEREVAKREPNQTVLKAAQGALEGVVHSVPATSDVDPA